MKYTAILQIWMSFNYGMDKLLHLLESLEWNN